MSDSQGGSGEPRSRGRGRGRGRYNGTDDNDERGPSKHRRTLTEEEKKDFISYQEEMDERRDRYERIVKLSRDTIIECKRIIFQLHRTAAAGTQEDKEKILKEADKRLTEVRNKMLRQTAKELCGLDQYYYVKSYDWAVEEYIEACAFYKFLKSGDILLYNEVQDVLQFGESDDENSKKIYVEVPEITYLMGIFDIGGELMRLAISEISSGSSNTATNVVNYMRSLYECYEFLGNVTHNIDWTKKSHTFRESLMKVENALYKWKIRETEVANIEATICS